MTGVSGNFQKPTRKNSAAPRKQPIRTGLWGPPTIISHLPPHITITASGKTPSSRRKNGNVFQQKQALSPTKILQKSPVKSDDGALLLTRINGPPTRQEKEVSCKNPAAGSKNQQILKAPFLKNTALRTPTVNRISHPRTRPWKRKGKGKSEAQLSKPRKRSCLRGPGEGRSTQKPSQPLL